MHSFELGLCSQGLVLCALCDCDGDGQRRTRVAWSAQDKSCLVSTGLVDYQHRIMVDYQRRIVEVHSQRRKVAHVMACDQGSRHVE